MAISEMDGSFSYLSEDMNGLKDLLKARNEAMADLEAEAVDSADAAANTADAAEKAVPLDAMQNSGVMSGNYFDSGREPSEFVRASLQGFEEMRTAQYNQDKEIRESSDLHAGMSDNMRKYKQTRRITEEVEGEEKAEARPIQTGEGAPEADIPPELAASVASVASGASGTPGAPAQAAAAAPLPSAPENEEGTSDARAVSAAASIDVTV